MPYDPQTMATASANAAILLSERFRLPLSQQNWAGLSGSWSGTGAGSSIDFHGHRQYQPGDDPRYINWQAYARTGYYIMKVYQEEVSPVVDILIDVSNSMFSIEKKALLSQILLNFSKESAVSNGASCHIWALQGKQTRRLEMSECDLGRLSFSPSNEGIVDSLHRLELRNSSLRVLISDLLFPGDPQPLMSSLCRGNGRLLIYTPADPSEFAPEWHGDLDLINIESGELVQSYIDQTTLSSYHKAYHRHFSLWTDTAIKNNAGIGRFYSHQPLAQQFEKMGLAKGLVEEAL